jgi:hypothetical protein
MVLAFQKTGDISIKAKPRFSNNQVTVKFPAKITKDKDSNEFRVEAAIKGFRFDQSGNTDPKVFDVYTMQVGIASVVGDTVRLSLAAEARGKNVADWEGHINVLVIADIESPPTGSTSTGSTSTGSTSTGSTSTGPTPTG